MEAKRKLYVLLTRFPGRAAIAIQAFTGCYYTHASIGLEEDMNTFYSIVGKHRKHRARSRRPSRSFRGQ